MIHATVCNHNLNGTDRDVAAAEMRQAIKDQAKAQENSFPSDHVADTIVPNSFVTSQTSKE
jgi:hypothetical protein